MADNEASDAPGGARAELQLRRESLRQLGYVLEAREQPQADLAQPGWVAWVQTPSGRVILSASVEPTAEAALEAAVAAAAADAAS